MLSFATARRLQQHGFRSPKKLQLGQHWYTVEGHPAAVINGEPGKLILMDLHTSKVLQRQPQELIYAPTAEEILQAIANMGKHRLLGKQPGAKAFEVNGANLHQYTTSRTGAQALAKEFVNVSKLK